MKNSSIRLVIILATISIIGVIVTQVYWVRKTWSEKQYDFDYTARTALRRVAERHAVYTKTTLPQNNLINQLTQNYYVVNINTEIDVNLLEHFLKSEFIYSNLSIDFEYGIYDCHSAEMVYGKLVHPKLHASEKIKGKLPKWDGSDYYFGVRFPTRADYIAQQLDMWIFSSLILLIVIIFFSYTLFVILKQKQLSEIQKDFINNMTHEFKTPISTIAISADVLLRPEIIQYPERLNNYAQIIKKENQRLKNQVERVLQMAELDKKKIDLKIEELNLHELVERIGKTFELKIQEKQGQLDYELFAKNFIIKADTVHLTNILYNLLDNALKYTGQKAPHIRLISKNIVVGSKKLLVISIADNGIGISKENQKHIFKKFYRVSTGNLHDVKGFGLGLNYVKTIVKAQKWEIALESSLEKGSTFSIFIPTV